LGSIQNKSSEYETTFALDIGCGSGVLTLGLLEKGIRPISIDLTLRSLKFTDQVAKRQGHYTERVLSDAQYLPLKIWA
jgi:methylase of polypeptide subunit release factors